MNIRGLEQVLNNSVHSTVNAIERYLENRYPKATNGDGTTYYTSMHVATANHPWIIAKGTKYEKACCKKRIDNFFISMRNTGLSFSQYNEELIKLFCNVKVGNHKYDNSEILLRTYYSKLRNSLVKNHINLFLSGIDAYRAKALIIDEVKARVAARDSA